MTLQDKVPVEPIAPERLERLERRIVLAAGPALARPRRPSLWPVGLALAGAAAGAIAMYALRPAPPAPATAPPIAVTTDERGATLALGDATIIASPATSYDVVRKGGGIDVRLDRGAVRLDVEPRKNRPPLWVHAGDVGVRVVGTAFTVSRAADNGEVSVEVEHGTVEVHKAGAVAPVTGGQRWSSRDGSVLAIAPRVPATDVPGAGTAPGDGTTGDGRIGANGTHTPGLATGPGIDVAVLSDRDRPTVTPGSGSGSSARVTPRNGGKPGTGSGSGSTSSASGDVPAETSGDLRSDLRRSPLKASMSVPGETPKERAAELSKIGYSTEAEAGAALYGLARTHMELGEHTKALRTLDAYFNRFHNKTAPEYEAARWLRLRILCASSFNEACRAAAYTYVKEFGGDDNAESLVKERVELAGRVPVQPLP